MTSLACEGNEDDAVRGRYSSLELEDSDGIWKEPSKFISLECTDSCVLQTLDVVGYVGHESEVWIWGVAR